MWRCWARADYNIIFWKQVCCSVFTFSMLFHFFWKLKDILGLFEQIFSGTFFQTIPVRTLILTITNQSGRNLDVNANREVRP